MKPTESLPILHIFPALFIYIFIYLFEKRTIIFTKLYTFLDFVLFKKGLNDRSFIALILKQKLNLHVMLIFINNYVHV